MTKLNKFVWINAAVALSLILATAIVCWLFFGCKRPVTAEQVGQAIVELDPFQKLGLDISNVTIDDQRTDSEFKKDRVWVTVEAVGEETVCVAQFLLDYYLYDQGWRLENVTELSPDHWSYRPLRGVSREAVDEIIAKQFPDRDLKLADTVEELENGRCTYSYTETKKLAHCTRTCTIEACYYFDFLNGGWKLDACTEVQRVLSDWDILGQWVGVPGEGWRTSGWSTDFTVTVNSMTDDAANVTMSHAAKGVFFEGEIPVAADTGIQFFVDTLRINAPYGFTLVFDGERAYLGATGTRHDEDLSRVEPELPETPEVSEETETPEMPLETEIPESTTEEP